MPCPILIHMGTCSKRVEIFTVAAQYTFSQDEIDPVLHEKELDSYLFTFGEAHTTSFNTEG